MVRFEICWVSSRRVCLPGPVVETGVGLLLAVEFCSDGLHLTPFKFGNADLSPSFGGPNHGAVHEPGDGYFSEGVRDHLVPAALLDEEALEEVRGPDGTTVDLRRWAMQASMSSMKQVWKVWPRSSGRHRWQGHG